MEEISDEGTGCSFGLGFFDLLFWFDYIYNSFTLGWISIIEKKRGERVFCEGFGCSCSVANL